MNWDDLTKEELLSRFLQLEERIDELEEQLIQKNEQSDKQAELIEKQEKVIEQQSERIEELEARLRKYENPHTPLKSDGRGPTSPRPRKTMKTTMSELTAVLPAEKTVTTQSGGLPLILTKKSRSPVTVVLTVVSTSTSRWASAPDSLRRYRTHSHQNSPSTTATATSATPVGRRRLN